MPYASNAIATAVVKGGFWPQNGVASLASISGRGVARREVARALDGKGQFALRQVARALDGVVAGSNATKTYTSVEASSEQGGKRNITTETLVNQVTVAGDVTVINADLLSLTTRTTMASPANKDGNPLGTR